MTSEPDKVLLFKIVMMVLIPIFYKQMGTLVWGNAQKASIHYIDMVYVKNVNVSTAFYEKILGIKPDNLRPTSSSFSLDFGKLILSLSANEWQPTGTYNLSFGANKIENSYEDFIAMEIPILQPLIEIEGKRAFIALDPDGNKITIYKPKVI